MLLEHRKALCEIVAQLLIADAVLTDGEREFLERLMTELGLRPGDKEDVINSVNFGDDVAEKVSRIPPEIGDALLRQLRDAAMVDGHMDSREAELIKEVERLLPPPKF